MGTVNPPGTAWMPSGLQFSRSKDPSGMRMTSGGRGPGGASIRSSPRSVRKLESLVVHGFTPHPGSSSEAIHQAAGDTHLPIRRSRLRQLRGRSAEDLRAAVAILSQMRPSVVFQSSGTCSCCWLIRPALRHHQQPDHVLAVPKHPRTIRNRPQNRIVKRLEINLLCCHRISGPYGI